jgi:hypothetical protein
MDSQNGNVSPANSDADINDTLLLCLHACDDDMLMSNFYCKSKGLGILWAAVQTELVTYRRVCGGDAWISSRFDLNRLLEGLQAGDGPSRIPLYEKDLMTKNFRDCGWLADDSHNLYLYTTAQEVCSSHFMNLEDWQRTTFITHRDRDCAVFYVNEDGECF